MKCSKAAAASLGYSSLKPEQLLATSSFLEGNYVFVSLPTGYGKSLCYAALPPAFEPSLGLFHTITRDAVACVRSKVRNAIRAELRDVTLVVPSLVPPTYLWLTST